MAAVSTIRQYAPQPMFGMQTVDTAAAPQRAEAYSHHPEAQAKTDRFVGHYDTGKKLEDLPWGRRICSKMILWYQDNKTFHGGMLTFHCMYPEKAARLGKDVASCSQYTLEAIQKHGVIKGILMGTGRIMNCNPVSQRIGFLKDRFIEA